MKKIVYGMRSIEIITGLVISKRMPPSQPIDSFLFVMSRESRRLDDRIRHLCARVAASTEPGELELILPELKSAIHEAIERLRVRAIAIFSGCQDVPPDRRKLP